MNESPPTSHASDDGNNFLGAAFGATVISGLIFKYFNNAYNDLWTNTIPGCTAAGGDILRDCGYLLDKAGSYQKWQTWAFWALVICGMWLLIAVIVWLSDFFQSG